MWKADEFLVIAHGTAEEVAPAKAIVDTVNPSRLDVHASAEEAEPPERLPHATSYPRGGLNDAARIATLVQNASHQRRLP
jgi:hypothetical protein